MKVFIAFIYYIIVAFCWAVMLMAGSVVFIPAGMAIHIMFAGQ